MSALAWLALFFLLIVAGAALFAWASGRMGMDP